MNLKKSLLVLSAVFMSLSAFAGNALNIAHTSKIFAKPSFTQEERQGATAYAFTHFFEDFAARLAEGNITEADAQLLQAIETYMAPALHAMTTASQEAVNHPQGQEMLDKASAELRQAGRQVIPFMVKEFDLREVNLILAENKSTKKDPITGFPVRFSAKDLDKSVLDLAVLDLSVAYLSATEELSVEETIILELMLRQYK